MKFCRHIFIIFLAAILLYGTAAGVAAEANINAPLQLNTPVWISFLETDEHVFSFKPTVSGPYRLSGVKETVAKVEDENGKRLGDNDAHNAEPPLTINPRKTRDCVDALLTAGKTYYYTIFSAGGSYECKLTFAPDLPMGTLSYDVNGGKNAPLNAQYLQDSYCCVSSATPTRGGYAFLGWSEDPAAVATNYFPDRNYFSEDTIYLSKKNATLYAIWVLIEPMPLGKSMQVSYKNQPYLSSEMLVLESKCFSFTPSASGEYQFSGLGNDALVAVTDVLNQPGNLRYDTYSGSCTKVLTAGKMAYFFVGANIGNYTLKLTQVSATTLTANTKAMQVNTTNTQVSVPKSADVTEITTTEVLFTSASNIAANAIQNGEAAYKVQTHTLWHMTAVVFVAGALLVAVLLWKKKRVR